MKLKPTCLALLAALLSAHAAAAENRIDNVIVTEADDGQSALVVVESQQVLKYRVEQVSYPPQIIIHVTEPAACMSEPLQRVDKKLVQGVQSACQSDAGATQPKPRLKSISIHLNHASNFSVTQNAWVLSVSLRRLPDGAGAPSRPASYAAPSAADYPPAPAGGYAFRDPVDLPGRTLSARPNVPEILQVGLANHKPLDIAHKELKLANRKLFEARRNFFPSVAARGAQTEGKTQSDPNDPATIANFRRKEIGVELGQPIFQSGRIYFSERQARAQKEAAELEISKLSQDASYDILRALFTYISAREASLLRRGLLTESQQILETTRRKKEIGVASESEYLGVLSAQKQVEYKSVSQDKDAEIARTRLMSVMDLEQFPDDLDVTLESAHSAAPNKNLEMNSLLAMAMANRPEMRIAQLNRKSREYARKAARGEYLFKVDASGFVGQSGAAFESETLSMKDSYNFGVKGVLYFGGSSVSPSLTRDKSAPDLGSTSRTETRAESLTVGLLDSLNQGTNLMQARIDEEKAAEEMRKMRREVTLEVKEAFFNYQKAKLQLDSARGEMEYRKKEVEIARAKDKLHQIEGTQILQSLTSLTEAQIALKETMSFYLISVAALEKAIGSRLPDRM